MLAVTLAGFWPTFLARLVTTDFWHSLHGFTAIGWILGLAGQSWLMSRGRVRWHRRMAVVMLVLLVLLVTSALYVVGTMQHNPVFPPDVRTFFAFIDIPSTVLLVLLVGLGLANRRTPAAHKRYMAATALLGLPPALTRLYLNLFAPPLVPLVAFHLSLLTVHVIVVALIVNDLRSGERRLAYPMMLVFYLAIQVLIGPVSASGPWRALMAWYGGMPWFAP